MVFFSLNISKTTETEHDNNVCNNNNINMIVYNSRRQVLWLGLCVNMIIDINLLNASLFIVNASLCMVCIYGVMVVNGKKLCDYEYSLVLRYHFWNKQV